MTLLPGDALKQFHYEQKLAKLRKRKTKKRKTSQQLRRAETLEWRANRKRELWVNPILQSPTASHPSCGLCGLPIEVFADCELDHKIPVRRGGDTEVNTHLVHTLGNRHKGSVSLEQYLEKYTPEELKAICRGLPIENRNEER